MARQFALDEITYANADGNDREFAINEITYFNEEPAPAPEAGPPAGGLALLGVGK